MQHLGDGGARALLTNGGFNHPTNHARNRSPPRRISYVWRHLCPVIVSINAIRAVTAHVGLGAGFAPVPG